MTGGFEPGGAAWVVVGGGSTARLLTRSPVVCRGGCDPVVCSGCGLIIAQTARVHPEARDHSSIRRRLREAAIY